MRLIIILTFLGSMTLALSGCEQIVGGFSFTGVPHFAGGQQASPG